VFDYLGFWGIYDVYILDLLVKFRMFHFRLLCGFVMFHFRLLLGFVMVPFLLLTELVREKTPGFKPLGFCFSTPAYQNHQDNV